jgi:tetratricopeptide (TPR) repeat protein
VVAAAATVALVTIGVSAWRRSAALTALPALPSLSDARRHPSALAEHLRSADRAVRADGASTDAIGALCTAYHADLFYDEAVRCYRVAEGLGSTGWRWTHARALVHMAIGQDAAATTALRRVVADAPDFSPSWWQLGEVAFKAGRRDEARTAWERAAAAPEPTRPAAPPGEPTRVTGAPIAAYATLGLARLALAEGEPDRARILLEEVTIRTPRFGPAFRLLGSAYTVLNRPDDASRAIRQADRLPPLDPYVDPLYETLARESRSATFLLQQASSADPSTQGAWREHLIRRALQYDPDNSDALFELASLLRALKRFDEALKLLQDYARRVPGDFQAIAAIGRNLSGLQRFAEAEGVLRRALMGADDANARYDLGVVLDQLGRVPEAIAEYERVLTRNPSHREALNNLGVDLSRVGKLAEAAARFEQVLRIDPENLDALVNLGLVSAATGQRSVAEEQFRRALALDPQNARALAALR